MFFKFRIAPILFTCLIASPAFTQADTDYMTVSDVVITLKNGTVIQVGENDNFSIGYDAESTVVSLKKAGNSKEIEYNATDMESIIFTRGEITDTCFSHQLSKKKWVMLSLLATGEKANLYTSPEFGLFRFHYLQKAGSQYCINVSTQASQFTKNLKDCPEIVDLYLWKNEAVSADSEPLSDDKLIEIIGAYNTCGQSKTPN